MVEKPFYLKGTGENLIKDELIQNFISSNPELEQTLTTYDLELKKLDLSHFESFIAWIISQQISGEVAEKLLWRTRYHLEQIVPVTVLDTKFEEFKTIGLSKYKIEYMKNTARFFEDKNQIDDHSTFSSKMIRQHYSQIRGIGPWTSNMFLIFSLGRMDVLATSDLVARKGIKRLYELPQLPSPKEIESICRNWAPLATIGTILSWAVMGE